MPTPIDYLGVFVLFNLASRSFNSFVNDFTYFLRMKIGCCIIHSADTAPSDALEMNNVSSTMFSYICLRISEYDLLCPFISIEFPFP